MIAINRTVPIDGQFEQRETIADDLEVIPTQDIRQYDDVSVG